MRTRPYKNLHRMAASSKTDGLKTIYLIRHAQAEHNVRSEFHIPDAPLTQLGRKQAAQILTRYPFLSQYANGPDIIITSPLTRTIETSLIAFAPKDPATQIVTMAELQENSDQACDTGSSIDVLKKRFPELSFNAVPEDWNSKLGRWSSNDDALDARAQAALALLEKRSEQTIAVVTHGGFCSKLTERWSRFENTECRAYKLVVGKRRHELQPITSDDMQARQPLLTDDDAVGAMPPKDLSAATKV